MYKKQFDWLKDRFPSKRPALPENYKRIYEDEYKRNRGDHKNLSNLKHKLEAWMHSYVGRNNGPKGAVLELGAGTLNHFSFEKEAEAYDIVEPFTALYIDKPELVKLRSVFYDINEIPSSQSYSKIFSIAALEHIEDLGYVIAKSALLLNDDGVMTHGIPSEGGALWYCAWKFGTGTEFRMRTGLPYAPLMHHEHINNAQEIVRVISIFFSEVSVKRFPLNWIHGSLYTGIYARKPKKQLALEFLNLCQ